MTPTAPAPAEPMGDEELTSAIRDLPDLQRGDDPNGYVTDILESCRSRIDAERARADAAEAARDAALAQDQAFRTRIWEIIDRDGLNNVPSDEIGAIARLVELAARPALPAPVLMETVEQVEALRERDADLVEGLLPFAEALDDNSGFAPAGDEVTAYDSSIVGRAITFGDLRRARALLQGQGGADAG